MRFHPRGFSLVEIVIALGVLSFAIIAIIGMFPVAMNESRDSRNETRAAAIAQMIFGQLRTPHNPKLKAIPVGMNATVVGNLTNGNWMIDLQGTNNNNNSYTGYDDEGQPVRRLTIGQYDGEDTPANVAYKVRVVATPNKPTAGLANVVVDVTYPPTIAEDKRTKKSFSLLMINTTP